MPEKLDRQSDGAEIHFPYEDGTGVLKVFLDTPGHHLTGSSVHSRCTRASARPPGGTKAIGHFKTLSTNVKKGRRHRKLSSPFRKRKGWTPASSPFIRLPSKKLPVGSAIMDDGYGEGAVMGCRLMMRGIFISQEIYALPTRKLCACLT